MLWCVFAHYVAVHCKSNYAPSGSNIFEIVYAVLKSHLKMKLFYVPMLEAKICSQTEIFSELRLQRSKHGSNCARSSRQQDMLALGWFSTPKATVVRGD